MFRFCYFFLLFGIFFSQNLHFDRLLDVDYINQDVVYDIKQDSTGYLWFATDLGLRRYDGIDADMFDYWRNDSGRVRIGNVFSIEIDQAQDIWMGTYQSGLLRFSPSKHKILSIPLINELGVAKRVEKVFLRDSFLFVASDKGLFKINVSTSEVISVDVDVDHTGFFYIGRFDSENLLFSYRTNAGAFRTKLYSVSKKRTLELPPFLSDIKQVRTQFSIFNSSGTQAIGTSIGAFVFQEGSSTLRHFSADTKTKISNSFVYSGLLEGEHTLWLGTTRALDRIDLATGKVKSYTSEPNNINSISGDQIYTLFLDRSNNIWAGTWANGVNRIDRSRERFIHKKNDKDDPYSLHYNLVWNFAEDKNGNIWIATEGSIETYFPKEGRFEIFKDKSNKINIAQVYCLVSDNNGDIWIGTEHQGIFRINAETREVTRFLLNEGFSADRQDRVLIAAKDREGNIWFGAQGGVFYLSNDDGKISKVDSTENLTVVALLADNENNMWVGTAESGLFKVNASSGKLKPASTLGGRTLPSGMILSLYLDEKERLFIGTEKGLGVYDISENQLDIRTMRDGLTSDIIYGITQDSNNDYWIITHNGVSKINNDFEQTYKFGVGDGLQHSEFNQDAIFKHSDGSIYMGGVNGFNILPVDGFRLNTNPPKIVIKDVIVNGSQQLYTGTTEFEITSDVHIVTVTATSLDFTNKDKVRYKYRLGGEESTWSNASRSNKHSFFNLSYGENIVEVLASNNDGLWAKKPAKIVLIRNRPFFLQTSVLTALLFILTFGIYFIHRMRVRRLEKNKRELESLVASRTKELEGKNSQLQYLNAFVKAISGETDLKNLVDVVLRESLTVPSIQRGSVMTLDHESREYQFIGAQGWDMKVLKEYSFTGEEMELWVTEDSYNLIDDVYVLNNFKGKDTVYAEQKSTLVIRIRIDSVIEGYIFYDNLDSETAFLEENISLIENLREHLIAIFNKVFLLDKLTYLNNLKNEFFGIAVHDLRSPLMQISGYADIISLEVEQFEASKVQLAQDMAEKIIQSTQTLNDILNTLLDISAIETGKLKLNLQEEDYLSIVEECEEMNRRRALLKEISISIKKPKEKIGLTVDKIRILEVVDNLLTNAIKYTNRGGKIEISFEKRHNDVVTHIVDNGLGISPSNLEQMFKSFRPFGSGPTEGEKSTGFGLAIVKKIVEIHGGVVWAKSEEGVGSTFSFSLPLNFHPN